MFPSLYFPLSYFATGYFPLTTSGSSNSLSSGAVALWQFVYEGSQKQFVDGYAFSIAYSVSDFLGATTPVPDVATSIVLVATDGTKTNPTSLILSTTPPTKSQIVMATFPPMVRGSYLVLPLISLNGTLWSSAAPDRIEVL
jgi:hypothetical protein